MTTGTLIRPTKVNIDSIDDHSTLNCKEHQQILQEERSISETKGREEIPAIFYKEMDSDIDDSYQTPIESASGRLANRVEWCRIVREKETNIWDSDKLKELLEAPIGSPISLTKEEAREIALLAAGRRPDLPAGKAFVQDTREVLGHAIITRVEKAS